MELHFVHMSLFLPLSFLSRKPSPLFFFFSFFLSKFLYPWGRNHHQQHGIIERNDHNHDNRRRTRVVYLVHNKQHIPRRRNESIQQVTRITTPPLSHRSIPRNHYHHHHQQQQRQEQRQHPYPLISFNGFDIPIRKFVMPHWRR